MGTNAHRLASSPHCRQGCRSSQAKLFPAQMLLVHHSASWRGAWWFPQAPCNGDDAAPSYLCPWYTPSAAASGPTWVSALGDIPWVRQGLPHQILLWVFLILCQVPVWVHPEQPWRWGELAVLPLPGRVLDYRNLLKCFSPSLAGSSKSGAYSFTLWASGTSEAV